jgi:hypothetical protein
MGHITPFTFYPTTGGVKLKEITPIFAQFTLDFSDTLLEHQDLRLLTFMMVLALENKAVLIL